MKRCYRPVGFSRETYDSIDCGKPVERWWSNYCEEHRGGAAWWECPPKPYLRRAFQLLGVFLTLLCWLSPWQTPRLALRAEILRNNGYWWNREQMDRVLSHGEEGPRPEARGSKEKAPRQDSSTSSASPSLEVPPSAQEDES